VSNLGKVTDAAEDIDVQISKTASALVIRNSAPTPTPEKVVNLRRIMSEEKGIPSGAESSGHDDGTGEVKTKGNAFNRLIHRKNDLNLLGKEMLQQSLQYDQAQLEADSVKVKRKLDFLVLPMVWQFLPNGWCIANLVPR
jgi:hypothetical protein